ncbi:hypothetical protein FRC06_011010, partial [Ceratobasidium sp. 370]
MPKSDYIHVDVPDSGPLAEVYERDSLLSLPPEALELLPLSSLSVSEFLNSSGTVLVAQQAALLQPVVFSRDSYDPNPHARKKI